MDALDDRSTTIGASHGVNARGRDFVLLNHKISQLEGAVQMQADMTDNILKSLRELRRFVSGERETVTTPRTTERPSFSDSDHSANFHIFDEDGPSSGARLTSTQHRRPRPSGAANVPQVDQPPQEESPSAVKCGKAPVRTKAAPTPLRREAKENTGSTFWRPSSPDMDSNIGPHSGTSRAGHVGHGVGLHDEVDLVTNMPPPPRPTGRNIVDLVATVESAYSDDETDDDRPILSPRVQPGNAGDEAPPPNPYNTVVIDNSEDDMDYEPQSPAPSLAGPSTQSVADSVQRLLTPADPPLRRAPTSGPRPRAARPTNAAAEAGGRAPVAPMVSARGRRGGARGGARRATRGLGRGRRKTNEADRVLHEPAEWEGSNFDAEEYKAREAERLAQLGSSTRGPNSRLVVGAAKEPTKEPGSASKAPVTPRRNAAARDADADPWEGSSKKRKIGDQRATGR